MADLKEQVVEAEEGAGEKCEELSEAVARLRQFEAGQIGLAEVSAECAALRRQVKSRDARVEELIAQADGLQLLAGEAVEENRELRERLGMQPRAGTEEKKSSSVERQRGRGGGGEEERALVTVLQRELDRLEEERLALKTENRKLAQQCGARAAKLGLQPGIGDVENVDDILKIIWMRIRMIREILTMNRKLAQQCGARAAKLGLQPGRGHTDEDVDDDGAVKDILKIIWMRIRMLREVVTMSMY